MTALASTVVRARAGVYLLAVVVVAGATGGCAGMQLKSNVREVRAIAKEARDRGAYKCAPRELALAETHAEFAAHELDQGDYFRARDHIRIADTNAREAYNLALRCAPRPPGDRDHDGILDNVDKCPNEPEDKDGFEDEDGCPDPDNDKDGILDADDKCPNEPGVPPDGCPKKYNLVVVTETKIELKQTVFFDTNKATIKPVSFALLNDVAQAMQDNPKIQVEIQGHTDSQGNDAFNLKLSQKRAESVRTYLTKKGVSGDRMTPKGYGENVPIADNRTSAGRAQNRRVEFVITAR